ncbi:MAG: hypothetical protein V5789_07515 [Colwellia sp.]
MTKVANSIPVRTDHIRVYETLPSPSREVFENSIPLTGQSDKSVPRLCLYEPNLKSVGTLDNTNAKGETTFSKTISSGFNFTSSQKIGGKVTFSVGVLFKIAGAEASIELSFTESWNTTETQTSTFKAPSGALVYLYQGIMSHRIINLNLDDTTYSWSDELSILDTNVIKTSSVPLLGPITNITNA